MTKKILNQNTKYAQKLIDNIEPNFFFSNKPINRFKEIKDFTLNTSETKKENLKILKEKINSIENCNLKNDSKKLILGSGNTNSKIMIIGETPGEKEEKSGLAFQGEIGE